MSRSSSERPIPGQLDAFFRPSSVAVIGVSARPDHISGRPIRYLLEKGFPGRIYPVNRRHDEIAGLTCYASVADLPEPPDVALVFTRASRVPAVLRECADRGVRFSAVFSSGFAEAGPQGTELQREIREILDRCEMRLIGPNCYGSLNLVDSIPLGFATPFELDRYPKGSIGFFSQSGAFGFGFLTIAMEAGLGFSYVMNSGNSMDIGVSDMFEFLAEDPDTKLVAGYIEGVRDGRRFARSVNRCVSLGKPVVLLKVGRSAVAARAARSHTGAMVGSETAFVAAAERLGIQVARDPDEFLDILKGLDAAWPTVGVRADATPNGCTGVAAITTSGASGILFADALDRTPLHLPALTGNTLERVESVLPPFATATNPIDTTAMILSRPELIERVLGILAEEPSIGSAAVMMSTPTGSFARTLSESIRRGAESFGKPVVVVVTSGERYTEEFYGLMRGSRIPVFQTPHRAARALAALLDRAHFTPSGWEPDLGVGTEPQIGYLCRNGSVGEVTAKRWISDGGIPVPRSVIVRTVEEARAAVTELSTPVVAKSTEIDVLHKADAGLIRLDLRDADAVARGYCDIRERIHAGRGHSVGSLDGSEGATAVLVEEQVAEGGEVVLGGRYDPVFGSLVGIGPGGPEIELIDAVRWSCTPVDRERAEALVAGVRGIDRILSRGGRGGPDSAHTETGSGASSGFRDLVDALVNFSTMVEKLGSRLVEVEVNPLRVGAHGVHALDAVLILDGASDDNV